MTVDLERVVDVARRAVVAGSAASLRRFQTAFSVETKADGTDVTIADREAEAAIVSIVRAAFPEHDLLTEESGTIGGGSKSRWIVDPLDGTRGFTRGGKFWGPLVAFEHEGEVLAGAMSLPALGRTYWAARGIGAYRDGERLHVSETRDWRKVTLSLGEMRALFSAPHGEGVLRLIRQAGQARCYGDLAGCALLLDGVADVWLEAGVKSWDLAPLLVLVEEAGGRFTDFSGTRTPHAGHAVATNGALHEDVLAALRPPGVPT